MKSGPAYYWDVNKASAPVLKAIRRAFAEGNTEEAARLTRENFNGKAAYETRGEKDFRFGSFTTMGELHIATGLDETKIRDYERTLSLDSALATVNFTAADGTRYTRSAFISYPDNVLVVRFTAERRIAADFCPIARISRGLFPESSVLSGENQTRSVRF